MSKKFLLVVGVLMSLSMVAFATGGAETGGGAASSGAATMPANDGPLVPYPETVTLSIGKAVIANDETLPEGDTVEDNVITRFYRDQLNLKFDYAFLAEQGEPYNTKARLAIASGDIPDVMVVGYPEFKMAYDAGLLEDLTDVFEKYAGENILANYATADYQTLETAKIGGRLMAIPSQQATGDFPSLLWVRQDWLDELGLEVPETLADAERVAQAFVNKHSDTRFEFPGNSYRSYTAVFTAHDAFPEMWVDRDGKAAYGSVLPEVRDALARLASWYANGIIDPEFATRTNPGEFIASGRCGMVFAPWWYSWADASKAYINDPNAVWVTTQLTENPGGVHYYRIPYITNSYVIVKKGIEHPEAVLKAINLNYDGYVTDAEGNPQTARLDLGGINEVYWPIRFLIVPADEIERYSVSIRKALAGELSDAEIAAQTAWWQNCYNGALAELTEPRSDLANWANGHSYTVGAKPLADLQWTKVFGLFNGQTETMLSPRWDYLTQLEEETFTRIINGQLPISAFDDFVKEWYDNGGQTATDEVNAALGR